MARAFTSGEKDDIARVLADTAERLFATQGLKKTSLLASWSTTSRRRSCWASCRRSVCSC